MKIALFGDKSYSTRADLTSWVSYLDNQYSYDIVNYTNTVSLWKTYQRFLMNYREFDTIIFLPTSHGRLSCDSINDIQSITHANILLKKMEMQNEDNKIKKDILNASLIYFEYLQDEDQELFLHGKIIQEIIQRCDKFKKKLIIVPVYEDSIYYQNFFDLSLSRIYNQQCISNDLEGVYRNNFINHLSPKNNQILAEKIHGIIEGTCEHVTMDDFKFEKFEDPSIYWPLLKKGV